MTLGFRGLGLGLEASGVLLTDDVLGLSLIIVREEVEGPSTDGGVGLRAVTIGGGGGGMALADVEGASSTTATCEALSAASNVLLIRVHSAEMYQLVYSPKFHEYAMTHACRRRFEGC